MSLTHQQMAAFTELAKAGFTFFVHEHDPHSARLVRTWAHGHLWALALTQYNQLREQGILCSLSLQTSDGVSVVANGGRATFALTQTPTPQAPAAGGSQRKHLQSETRPS